MHATRGFKQGYSSKAGLLLQVKMTEAMPTVHHSTKHTNREKNILYYCTLGVCPLPTDSCQLQAAGGLDLPPAPLGSPPKAGREEPVQFQIHRPRAECAASLTHTSLYPPR